MKSINTIDKWLKSKRIAWTDKDTQDRDFTTYYLERPENKEPLKVAEVNRDRTGGYLDLTITLFPAHGESITSVYNGCSDDGLVWVALQDLERIK